MAVTPLPKRKLVIPSTLLHVKPGELPAGLLVSVMPYGKLHPLAADAYNALRAAAFADGLTSFRPSSAGDCYRSIALQRQGFLARYTLTPIDGAPTRSYNNALYYLRPGNAPMAAPGTSRHNLGLAVDVAEANGNRLGFMLANCLQYGFSWELDAEPWHIFYYPGDKVPAPVTLYLQRFTALSQKPL